MLFVFKFADLVPGCSLYLDRRVLFSQRVIHNVVKCFLHVKLLQSRKPQPFYKLFNFNGLGFIHFHVFKLLFPFLSKELPNLSLYLDTKHIGIADFWPTKKTVDRNTKDLFVVTSLTTSAVAPPSNI